MRSRVNLQIRKSTGDPPHLKSLEQRGPRVSIATGWNIKSGGKEEYLVSFLIEAVSTALPAEWDVECRYESARVLTTVTPTSEVSWSCHGINVSPPGRLPSSQAPWLRGCLLRLWHGQ